MENEIPVKIRWRTGKMPDIATPISDNALKYINDWLKSVKDEAIKYHASVEIYKEDDNSYKIECKCYHEPTRQKMQSLVDFPLPSRVFD